MSSLPAAKPAAAARVIERLAERGGGVECLRVPATLFGWIVRARNLLYERRLLPSFAPDLPVISVGNLSTGGVGKTPFVRWLAQHFAGRGVRVGVLSRGYRAQAGQRSDEARELLQDLPSLLHVERANRVRGALELQDQGAELIVLDDGFQHRRLARDLDLVLVDATQPWGLPAPRRGGAAVEALLPRGLLREPPTALRRAHHLVITRSDQVGGAELNELRARLRASAPMVPQALACHRPHRLRLLQGAELSLGQLRGQAVVLASAIGNARAFQRTVEGLGARVVAHERRPDHDSWQGRDFADFHRELPLVVTSKDAVKLEPCPRAIWVLEVRFELLEGAAGLLDRLEKLPYRRGQEMRAALHAGLHG